jgi:hypothetical protein
MQSESVRPAVLLRHIEARAMMRPLSLLSFIQSEIIKASKTGVLCCIYYDRSRVWLNALSYYIDHMLPTNP